MDMKFPVNNWMEEDSCNNKNNDFGGIYARGLASPFQSQSGVDRFPPNPLILINNQWQYYALDWDKIQQDF